MQIKEWISKKIFSIVGLSEYNGSQDEDRESFINDKRSVLERKLSEYDVWYQGDSDELLNFYTRDVMYKQYEEPIYNRNHKGYFWNIASSEEDIKRTHSGLPRNIVDTLTAIMGKPEVNVGNKDLAIQKSNEVLKNIFEENEFWDMYSDVQIPMTMVEGWGAYKIDYDLDVSEYPIIKYYRAKDVDFIYKEGRRIGIIYKNYYTDKKGYTYLIVETRAVIKKNLYIMKNVFKKTGEEVVELNSEAIAQIDELSGINLETQVVNNYNKLLGVPCFFYKDCVNNDGYGRSVYTGKIDLFDDLDQCLSQSSNTVRRSTAIEYFNTDFLERSKETGAPIMPKAYDRKYTGYEGGKDINGTDLQASPVTVTQPQLQFNEYNAEANAIIVMIINGLISPATLGMDVAKKDNADAQREKEKVTIFTRNIFINREQKILKELINQLLSAYELMHRGEISCRDYSVSVKFSEFADDSFENKLKNLGEAYSQGTISTDMYLDKLYGESISEAEREREKQYLEESRQEPAEDDGGMPGDGGDIGGLAEMLGGGDEDF